MTFFEAGDANLAQGCVAYPREERSPESQTTHRAETIHTKATFSLYQNALTPEQHAIADPG